MKAAPEAKSGDERAPMSDFGRRRLRGSWPSGVSMGAFGGVDERHAVATSGQNALAPDAREQPRIQRARRVVGQRGAFEDGEACGFHERELYGVNTKDLSATRRATERAAAR
jgi:hypothetical protein